MGENVITAGKEASKYFPYADQFHLQRNSFWAAGQDSFTLPPAQNPDFFESLTNIEPIFQGGLRRRRGYQLLSNQAPATPYLLGYSFRSEALGTKAIIYTSSKNVLALNEDGTVLLSTLFIPGVSATFVPRMVLSRSYGYFADGAMADYVKWDGTTNANKITNWGINNQATPSQTIGPNACGTASDVSVPGSPWTATSGSLAASLSAADGVFAQSQTTNGHSDFLDAQNFSFAVSPTSQPITGIQVQIKCNSSNSDPTTSFCSVQLLRAGVAAGVFKNFQFPAINGFVNLGGSSDDWGLSLTGADINASTFGCQIYFQDITNATQTYNVDFVEITAYISGNPIVVTPGGAASGNITLLNGRNYTIAYRNSLTGHTSDFLGFTQSTGPLTSQNVVLTSIPVDSDPQVDQKLILATADGGDETTLYLIAIIPNATTTYTDNTPDGLTASVSSGPFLLGQPIYQETQSDGTLHGIANNDPPPIFNFPTKHKGRIYGSIGNTLYFSKSLADVTTSTGTITSKWEEAFPATYRLDISETAETIKAIFSDGETLWIGTERCIRRLVGDGPENFQEPEIQFNETGVLSMETVKVVFSEGQPVGAVWVTPDNRVMASDFNTYQDIGTPIQNFLNIINKQSTVPIHACFYSKGPSEYFILHIPRGGNNFPDTLFVYNLKTKAWVQWAAQDNISASLFFIDGSGNSRWTFASVAGPLYEWQDSLTQDRVNNTPLTYPITVYTSWLDYGDPTLHKALNQIIVGTGDSNILFTLFGGNVETDIVASGTTSGFGTTLVSNVHVTTGPLEDLFVPLASAVTKHRWYKMLFSVSNSQVKDFLSFYNIEALPLHRW